MSKQDQAVKNKKEDSLELFRFYLKELLEMAGGELNDEDKEILRELNWDIIILFDEDPDFQKSLENALYKNKQKLTFKKFTLEDKPVRPTIENWIKHFIKSQGTDMFDNMVISKFLSSSENVKRLDNKEVALVRLLLRLYRNLKFFPDSMEGEEPEKWEIIPLGAERKRVADQEGQTISPSKAPATSPAQDKNRKIPSESAMKPKETKKKTEEYIPRGSEVERSPRPKKGGGPDVSDVSEESKRLKKLKKIKNNYPEGSLERKAIESEIRELENRDQS